ncbi:RNA-binding S4 domain-containing protein [Pleurocapsales cyanobacterium LEGE 06147]|nr:RNA-binding S4 domain-containing protein [Pleurocapsales cyanobacterium LEGE 06147]
MTQNENNPLNPYIVCHLEADEKQTDSQNRPFIKLDQFLKWQGIVRTGGEAKLLIQGTEVSVNGTIETRRGRKLVSGDRVTVTGTTYEVQLR